MIEQIEIKKIKQIFNKEKVENLSEYIVNALVNSDLSTRIKPGDKVGITVGSRGVSNIDLILKKIIIFLKRNRVHPFILPAMGSHGGATSEGQLEILESYGITEESMGAPILSSMETIKIGEINNNIPIYFSKEAMNLDGIIALNRVKVHTDFDSNHVESGISKVLAIGLGKEKGASSIHSFGVPGLKKISNISKIIINKAPVIQGIGILENSYDQTMEIVCCPPKDIVETDNRLLKKCKKLMPKLPIDSIDILIVQEIGKDISGTGLDTNIIGRRYINGDKENLLPKIKQLVVLDLSDKSHGNAYGIGLADITTRKLVDKIDYNSMYTNAITCTFLRRVKVPIAFGTEREAFEIALRTCWNNNVQRVKLAIIKNTLELEYIYLSKAAFNMIEDKKNLKICKGWEKISFDENGLFNRKL
ncbi:MAG: DUF2088 domain-containing protein [Atribacterota bacterium]|nr:DUF2088 domain-containing protein [Atribacterota bacterium]